MILGSIYIESAIFHLQKNLINDLFFLFLSFSVASAVGVTIGFVAHAAVSFFAGAGADGGGGLWSLMVGFAVIGTRSLSPSFSLFAWRRKRANAKKVAAEEDGNFPGAAKYKKNVASSERNSSYYYISNFWL